MSSRPFSKMLSINWIFCIEHWLSRSRIDITRIHRDRIQLLRQSLSLRSRKSIVIHTRWILPAYRSKERTNSAWCYIRVDGFRMPERVKLSYEMEYFCGILLLFFRAVLLQSDSDFSAVIQSTVNPISSSELIELNERLNVSREKIAKFSFVKKHFRQETQGQFQLLQSSRSQLKDRLMEEQHRVDVAQRYCHTWKTNHILQWIEMLLHIEQTYTKTIEQYERVLRQTDQTHQETIRMLVEQNRQIQLRSQHCYEHYLSETDRFERELRHFRHDFQTIKQQRQDMSEEYQRMKLIVDEYHQKKAEESLQLEKQKQQSEAVKRLQAWWRGTMVRHLRAPQRRKKKK